MQMRVKRCGAPCGVMRTSSASSTARTEAAGTTTPLLADGADALGVEADGRPVSVVVLLPPGNSAADSAPVLSSQPPGSIQARALMPSGRRGW